MLAGAAAEQVVLVSMAQPMGRSEMVVPGMCVPSPGHPWHTLEAAAAAGTTQQRGWGWVALVAGAMAEQQVPKPQASLAH
jgi:hypothetical protein